MRHAESDDFGPREGACAGLRRHAAAHRRPVRPGERLTLGTAPRPRVFRTVRDLRTARVAAGHTGLPGRHVFPWRAGESCAAVPCRGVACRARVLEYRVYADRVVRRYRQGRGRGAAGNAGRRFGRYVPYRDAAEVLPNALPVPTIPARHRCHARRDGRIIRQ